MLITFLVNCYRKIMNVLLIALFIIMPIAGGVIGKIVSPYRENYILLGVILGLVAVVIFEFLIIPPVFVLFEINEKLKTKNPEEKKKISEKIAAEIEPPKKESEEWVCPFCGAHNIANTTMCIACFKPKPQ